MYDNEEIFLDYADDGGSMHHLPHSGDEDDEDNSDVDPDDVDRNSANFN